VKEVIMPNIFEETVINGMKLANRLVRSATWEGMCDADGRPTKKLIDCYADLSRGGVGLIISSYSFVRKDGKQLPGQMGIYTDAFAPEMKEITAAVHANGGKICMQLVHAGGQTSSKALGSRPVAPSSVETLQFPEVPMELSVENIRDIIAKFGASAVRAREYGFDGVQLHAAHGYLINQFLSPLTNRRTDDYGGSLENRIRFLMEVYRTVRSSVGSDFPVLAKLNLADNLADGLNLEDALEAARAIDQEGIDAIEVSAGTPASGDNTPIRLGIQTKEQEAYNLPLATRLKQTVGCPVMVVGGIRSIEIAEGILQSGDSDYIALARPLIREPHLPLRWLEGNRERATCISCNGCFKPGLKEGGIYCVIDRIENESRVYSA
jgi:2,4-dienoyl-CoA reductase-like NADH-dependent reductase (Old Yellow Enzyme family)